MIHPTAQISPKAQLASDVRVGPFCVIGAGVQLGPGCVLHSHVVLEGPARFGARNEFFPFSALGQKTQDLKYTGEPTALDVGDDNVFRENVTVHRSTHHTPPTTLGSRNLLLAYSHVAHDCQMGDDNILSNGAMLAGHVEVGHHVIISGMSGSHQFIRIGDHAMIGGMTKVTQDVPPFTLADGNPARLRGLNLVGLKRRGFGSDELTALKSAYRQLFFHKEGNLHQAVAAFSSEPAAQNPRVRELLDFIATSQRGLTR